MSEHRPALSTRASRPSRRYVTIDRYLPNGGTYYASIYDRNSAPVGMWAALVEKAYAQFDESGLRDGVNRYDVLDAKGKEVTGKGLTGGHATDAFATLLGNAGHDYNTTGFWHWGNGGTFDDDDRNLIINALAKGSNVVTCTRTADQLKDQDLITRSTLVDSHCYTVLGVYYDAGARTWEVKLRNPWGASGSGIGTNQPGQPVSTPADPGIVTISWDTFRKGMSDYVVV